MSCRVKDVTTGPNQQPVVLVNQTVTPRAIAGQVGFLDFLVRLVVGLVNPEAA
jgi:hypothetical protein